MILIKRRTIGILCLVLYTKLINKSRIDVRDEITTCVFTDKKRKRIKERRTICRRSQPTSQRLPGLPS